MFNQDEKWDESFQLRYLYSKITRADGVIIATPEHNHTIAPLKSVLEWLSYEGSSFRKQACHDCWSSLRPRNFPTLKTTCAKNPRRSWCVLSNEVLAGQEPYDNDGNITNEGTVKFLESA